MPLPAPEAQLLRAMAAGSTLKVHRDMDGHKDFVLHPLKGAPEPVPAAVAVALVEAGLIDSNKKFPAATFWLTERGRAALAE
jgi:hypothetical protein